MIYGVAYLVEIPAGAIADNFGLKRVLLTAFVMYIVSFLFYAGAGVMKTQVHRIVALVIASAFYGLGEAFRSGVHKAMILRFLDKHGLIKHKAFIYSQTRSYSNLGSALNALGSIGLVIVLKSNYKMFFLISAIPFVLDFIMVSTYPSYMNETPLEKKNKTMGAIMSDTKTALISLLSETRSRRTVLSTSSFMALFLTLKHYVQPVVALYVVLENISLAFHSYHTHSNTDTAVPFLRIMVYRIQKERQRKFFSVLCIVCSIFSVHLRRNIRGVSKPTLQVPNKRWM